MAVGYEQHVKRLIRGGDPDDLYPAPGLDAFKSAPERIKPDRDFAPGDDIARIAGALIIAHEWRRFDDLRVRYLWKREGGNRNGVATLGECVKTSGLARHFGDVDYVVWLAADHCRSFRLTRYHVEALVYHELLHADVDERGKPTLRPHDFEGFGQEITEYGLWHGPLVVAGDAIAQLRFPFADED